MWIWWFLIRYSQARGLDKLCRLLIGISSQAIYWWTIIL
jgi:hypothetical protein